MRKELRRIINIKLKERINCWNIMRNLIVNTKKLSKKEKVNNLISNTKMCGTLKNLSITTNTSKIINKTKKKKKNTAPRNTTNPQKWSLKNPQLSNDLKKKLKTGLPIQLQPLPIHWPRNKPKERNKKRRKIILSRSILKDINITLQIWINNHQMTNRRPNRKEMESYMTKVRRKIFLKWNLNLKINKLKTVRKITILVINPKSLTKLKKPIKVLKRWLKSITPKRAILIISITVVMPRSTIGTKPITRKRFITKNLTTTKVTFRDILIMMTRKSRITLVYMEKFIAIVRVKDMQMKNRPTKTMISIQDLKMLLHKLIDLNVGLKNLQNN